MIIRALPVEHRRARVDRKLQQLIEQDVDASQLLR
jgi:hypothetical protein